MQKKTGGSVLGWMLFAALFIGSGYFRYEARQAAWNPEPEQTALAMTVEDSVIPPVPWPLWDEAILLPNCENAGTASQQLLMCYEPDGSASWGPSDVPANCRMIPIPGNVTMECR